MRDMVGKEGPRAKMPCQLGAWFGGERGAMFGEGMGAKLSEEKRANLDVGMSALRE